MIYLLHFSRPLGGPKHEARHYLGFVDGNYYLPCFEGGAEHTS